MVCIIGACCPVWSEDVLVDGVLSHGMLWCTGWCVFGHYVALFGWLWTVGPSCCLHAH